MKKLFVFLSGIAFTLAACAGATSSPSSTTASEAATAASSALSTDYENALPVSQQLALGILALEDTALPIDATQAAALLPLWKAARALSQSETAAEAEVQAVFRQLEAALKPEQLAAIARRQLTQEDLAAVFRAQGLTFGPGGGAGFADLTPEQQATLEAARASGQPPAGGFPGGGGFPGAGGPGGPGGGEFQNLSPEARETAVAGRRAQFGTANGLNPVFYELIIQFLEGKLPPENR